MFGVADGLIPSTAGRHMSRPLGAFDVGMDMDGP